LAKHVAELSAEKKAEDIIVLDMRKIVNFCDYFVVCSGNTDRQVRAIGEYIEESLQGLGMGVRLNHKMNKYDWVVFDVGDVITHIFQKQLREFYKIEYLWQEAKRVKWE